MKKFIKENLIKILAILDKIMKKINKLSPSAAILIVAIILGGFYFAVEYNKQHSIEKQQQIKIEQEKQEQLTKDFKEKKAKEEAEKALNDCLVIAESIYSNSWYKECKAQGKVTTKCIDIHELSFDEYLEKYELTVEDYTRERNLKISNPSDPTAIRLGASFDYLIRANDECSCLLPTSKADRLNENLEKNKTECFKRYPQ